MKTKKHTNKLQKSSGLFMQLGLVLTLTVVYALFENKTEINKPTVMVNENTYEESDIYFNKEIVIERIKPNKLESIKKRAQFIDEIVITDDPDITESTPTIIKDDIPDESIDISDQLGEVLIPDDLEPDNHLMINVQEVPIFPGCEKGSRAERKTCFEKKVSRFISRKFNSDLGSQLGLSSGNQKIYVKFLITKTGDIEIIDARAPHKRLEKEGKRVVHLLPTMIPGRQNGKPVNVSYMVPISFNVE